MALDRDDAPAAINAYLIERVHKLEIENAVLLQKVNKYERYLEQRREEFAEMLEMVDAFFEVLDGKEPSA